MKALVGYLLFPKSENKTDSFFFVADSIALSTSIYVDYCRDLELLLEVCAREKKAEFLYQDNELDDFLLSFDLNVYPNPIDTVTEDMLDYFQKYKAKSSTVSAKDNSFVWQIDGGSAPQITPIEKDAAIAVCAHKKMQEPDKAFVIVNHQAINLFKPNIVAVIADNFLDNDLPEMVKIDVRNNHRELFEWLKDNRTPRKYNYEDSRHGENGVGNRGGKNKKSKGYKSPLMSSKQHSASLLDDAIGSYEDHEGKRLYYFDAICKLYIIYEYEGDNPQNQYHSYHVEPDDVNRDVPKDIQEYFNP